MKIIVSPSKEMSKDRPINEECQFRTNTKKILDHFQGLTIDQRREIYKVSEKILKDINSSLDNFYNQKSYMAGDLYSGIAFRNMGLRDLSSDEKSFIKDKLFILSAFYGPVKITDPIKPYRLDFNTKIKIDSKNLKKLWEDDFNLFFRKGEIILNLASDEFSSILYKENYRWIDFDFYEIVRGEEKRHSMISKKARGNMVRFIIKKRIEKVEELKSFNLDGYVFNEEKSNSNYFVYSRNK